MRSRRPGEMELPWELKGLCLFLAGALLLNLAALKYQLKYRTRYFWPYNHLVFLERFPDFTFFAEHVRRFAQPSFFSAPTLHPFMYPAPIAVAYRVLYLPPHPLRFFLLLLFCVLGVGSAVLSVLLRRRGVRLTDALLFPPVLLGCSYAVWFEVKQANIEIVLWAVLAGALGLWLAGRSYPAAVLFGVAISCKIYPLVYLGLFVSFRQFRQAVLAVVTAAATTVLSLRLLSPDIAWANRGVSASLQRFRMMYMLRVRFETQADHSLFALYKYRLHPLPAPAVLDRQLQIYLMLTAAFGIVLYLLVIRRLPLLNQITALTVCSVLLPPTSFDYTLLSMFLPFSLLALALVDEKRRGVKAPRGRLPVLACYGLLFAFLQEFVRDGHWLEGQIRCVVLVVLLGLAVTVPLAQEPLPWPGRERVRDGGVPA